MDQRFIKVIIAIAAVVMGLMATVMSIKTKAGFDAGDYVETTALVTDVVTYPGDADTDTTYDLYIDYKVGNDTYSSVLGGESDSKKKGEELTIYYNKNKPSEITSVGRTGTVIGIVIGIVVTLAGAGFLAVTLFRKRGGEQE